MVFMFHSEDFDQIILYLYNLFCQRVSITASFMCALSWEYEMLS